jgi:hypothetical protein
MLSSQYRQKLIQARSLLHNSKRGFQHFGKEYLTGFDRMLLDKLEWLGPLSGRFFALFGITNLLLFGASKVSTKE